MAKYIVTSPIKRDGKWLAVGKPCNLNDDEAGPLLAAGCIAPDSGKQGEKKPDSGKQGD